MIVDQLRLFARASGTAQSLTLRDEISSFGMIDADVPLPLPDAFWDLTVSAALDEPVEHELRFAIEGPDEAKELVRGRIRVDRLRDGRHRYSTGGPINMQINAPGDYSLTVFDGESLIGERTISARVMRDRAKARFTGFQQIEQGIDEEGRRLMRGAIPFTLFSMDGAFGGYAQLDISQPEGGNFETDPLHLQIPPVLARLRESRDFLDAAKSTFDAFSKVTPVGTVADGSTNFLGVENLVIGERWAEFDLPGITQTGW